MEQLAIFEEKVALSPKDMNRLQDTALDEIILEHLREKLEGRCSVNGYVLPQSLELLSRSIGQLENGRYTGNVIFHVQAQGRVLNPSYGVEVEGEVLKNVKKMGLYLKYRDAIRIMVPRDLHLGNEEFENIESGDRIRVELRKSRFQVKDEFILSVGVYKGKASTAIEA